MKPQVPLLITVLTLMLVWFPVLPKAQAVNPPPDGGYPNFTTAEGTNALKNLTTGAANTAVGWHSLFSNTDGSFNTAVGAGTLLFNVGDQSTGEGLENTAVGTAALLFNSTGFQNTAVGSTALENNATGLGNTAIGVGALFRNNTGLGNIALGANAGFSVTTANFVIAIGTDGANESNSCFIGNIYSNVQPIVGTDPDSVTITQNGKLGRGNVSSRRYKHDIKPMDQASEVLFALKPVSFRYNKQYDAAQTLAFGLIAEEVAEVAPSLVGRNPKGEPESVRYEQINAMLLNEFLKEHKKVEEQQATIAELKSTVAQQQNGMEILSAQLKEQAAQIQKVNARLEVSKLAAQFANYEQ